MEIWESGPLNLFASPLEMDLAISDLRLKLLRMYSGELPSETDLESFKRIIAFMRHAIAVSKPSSEFSPEDVPDESLRNALKDAFAAGNWNESPFDERVFPDIKISIELLSKLLVEKRLSKNTCVSLLSRLDKIQLPALAFADGSYYDSIISGSGE